MKVLLLTKNQEKFKNVSKSIEESFVGLELVFIDSREKALDSITSDGPWAFFMIDMIVSDNISEVINDMIDLAGDRPVIMCGSDTELEQISKSLIIKNEGNIVLKNLEDPEKVRQILRSALKWSNQHHYDEGVVKDDKDIEYITFKVGNLYLYESFPHNLYVKIGESKYVLALEKETPIYHSQIAKLVKRGIKLVHIEKDKHLNFLENSMLKATDYFKLNPEFNKKTIMAHLRCSAIVQDYLVNLGVTTKISGFIDELLQHIILSLDSEFHFKDALEYYNFKFESIISKSLISAYTCYYMMKELGWKSETTRKKFLLAALVQDTFLKNDKEAELNSIAEAQELGLSEEEIEEYQAHPKMIADIVRQLSQFPDIDFLIEQHHEKATRDGFPMRPPPSEIQVAVCVFIIATQFARDIDGKTFEQSNLEKLMHSYKEQFTLGNFKEPYSALKKSLAIK